MCNLAGEMVRRAVPVLVLGLERENVFASDFTARNIPVVTQDERRNIFEDRMRQTMQALAEFRPTAVVGCLGAASYEVLRYIPPGITRILMVQADHAIHYEGAAPYGAFVDAVVGVSEHIRQTLSTMPEFRGVPSHDLTCGVAVPETFTPRRLSPGKPLKLLYLGRLERRQKRVDLFPELLKQLIESDIPFIWEIVGEGPDAEFLAQAMRTQRPHQQVRLVGPVPYKDVPTVLERADILLLASHAEGLPLCVLEAMACGVVPVVTDLASGIPELLDDSNGRRIPVDNIAGYAEAIIGLYRHPELTESLSRNARATIERGFSTAVMADRWLGAFPPSNRSVDWSPRWKVKPPLNTNRPLYFSKVLRPFRRLALRLQQA
jgi:glycosyltransferase involved in cell wall biosynthesis